jgi:biopolymer transport protein ExbD
MGRAKLPRKSTIIDMTAMCDVAFLLLSFFILTTKFKPPEAISVVTPNSVSAKAAEQKDVVMVTIDKDGKIFITMDDEDKKEFIANSLNTTRAMGIDVKAFKKAEFFGSSFANLNAYLKMPIDQRKGENLPGIPYDTTAGTSEITQWMGLIQSAYYGTKLKNLYVKGDNMAKYPAFEAVIEAFKANDFLKFQMVTNPEPTPTGTDYYKLQNAGEKIEE